MSLQRRNVILTGVPRSGTTLTCHLLNQTPHTLALHEPMEVRALAALGGRTAIVDAIAAFFENTRTSLLATGTVSTKLVGGRLPVDPMAERFSEGGLRRPRARREDFRLDKPLAPNFLLVVKHPAAFTALLEDLVGLFPCFAVVRNPLAVLASWNTIDTPHRRGRAPAAERLDQALRRALAAIDDRVARQLSLLSWFYGKYHRLLSPRSILRYEEIVSSRGRTLTAITPRAAELDEPLECRNLNRLYDASVMRTLGDVLMQSDGEFWRFYSRDSVRQLLDDLSGPP